jgi:adenylosuccinate lyase
MNTLSCLSPLDGRYVKDISELKQIFSEYALIRYRLYIEIEYFLFLLTNVLNISIDKNMKENILNIYLDFTEEEAIKIKLIEETTKHDVKAVEYYIKEKLDEIQFNKYKEYVHFGLTSQDINSVCYVIQMRNFIVDIFRPLIVNTIDALNKIIKTNKNTIMLSRTHGQIASPTTVAKEFLVYKTKLTYHLQEFEDKKYQYNTKFGGAVGNLNAHYVAYPKINWGKKLEEFLSLFDLGRHKYTTQIDNYDYYSIIFDQVKRIQTILLDLCQDIWLYISMDYFILKKKQGEIGSSTMPHKINPINFENAEGNFQLSNTLLEFLSRKLPVSRLQRDLTDSTILRNLGTAFGYGIVGLKSLHKGLEKLEVNKEKIAEDLNNHWEVIFEGIQTILRRENIENAYELSKIFIENNKNPSKVEIHKFIEGLNISQEIKLELKQITPQNYIGKI